MEKFIHDIEAYAALTPWSAGTVVQKAGFSGNSFHHWKVGKSTPTMRTVERVREFMAANPPESTKGTAPKDAAA